MANDFEFPCLNDFPEYAALHAKKAKLVAERETVQQQLNSVFERIAAERREPSLTKRGRRVAVLLDDPQPEEAVDRSRIGELNQLLADLNEAIEEVERRIGCARVGASHAICERIRPQHAMLVRSICLALLEAHKANVKYQAFADALNAADIAWSMLGPMHPHILGNPSDAYSRVAIYLREAAATGAISEADIPDELMSPPRPKQTEIDVVRALAKKILPRTRGNTLTETGAVA